MANQWFRVWHDMPNDPKWRTIARASKQPISVVISVYLHVLANASNATERGRTQGLNCEDIASALDVDVENVEAILAAMQGRVLDGDAVSGWEKRQPVREDGAAERAKAWREAKKQANERGANGPNASERTPNAEERPYTDTDTDNKKNRRGSRLPADWKIPEDWKTEAKRIRPDWHDQHIERIADGFRDYWIAKTGQSATKADWLATWRNWCRNDKSQIYPAPSQSSTGPTSAQTGMRKIPMMPIPGRNTGGGRG